MVLPENHGKDGTVHRTNASLLRGAVAGASMGNIFRFTMMLLLVPCCTLFHSPLPSRYMTSTRNCQVPTTLHWYTCSGLSSTGVPGTPLIMGVTIHVKLMSWIHG